MSELFEPLTIGFVVKENIYTAEDGKTVVPAGDKRAAFLKFAANARITPKQKEALIFPKRGKSQPVPDAEQRNAKTDAETRGGEKP